MAKLTSRTPTPNLEPQPEPFTTADRKLLIELANRTGVYTPDSIVHRAQYDEAPRDPAAGGLMNRETILPSTPPMASIQEVLVARLNENTRLIDFIANTIATVYGGSFEHTKDSPELGTGYPVTENTYSVTGQLSRNNERLYSLACGLAAQFNFPPPPDGPGTAGSRR
jgi:hypothetical protein